MPLTKARPMLVALSMLSLAACSGGDSYTPDDLGVYLQSGTWYDDEAKAELIFRDDGIYSWMLDYSGDSEDGFGMFTGAVASYCGEQSSVGIEGVYDMPFSDVLALLKRCDLPAEASDMNTVGSNKLTNDGKFGTIHTYKVTGDNTIELVDMFGDSIKTKIAPKSATEMQLTDDTGTYHFKL